MEKNMNIKKLEKKIEKKQIILKKNTIKYHNGY